MDDRELFLWYAKTFLGKWYKWGGDDPSGFDCSGLVLECCQAIGWVNANTDLTADNMWVRWKDYAVVDPIPGCLVFWLNTAGKAVHVEICLRGRTPYGQALAIGAKGGGSTTHTVDDAIKQNAFIKVRPILGRSTGDLRYVDFLAHTENP